MCDGITYPFTNLNRYTVEVWECKGNFIAHFMMEVITYPCWDLSQTMLVNEAQISIVWVKKNYRSSKNHACSVFFR